MVSHKIDHIKNNLLYTVSYMISYLPLCCSGSGANRRGGGFNQNGPSGDNRQNNMGHRGNMGGGGGGQQMGGQQMGGPMGSGGPGPRFRGRGGGPGGFRPPPGYRGPPPGPPYGPRGPRFSPRGPPPFDHNWGPMPPPGMGGPMGPGPGMVSRRDHGLNII